MNRELKFRAYNKKYDIITVNCLPIPKEFEYGGEYTGIVMLPMNDDYIFMQYTGLKDKHGTEIYEGDILEHVNGKGNHWCVVYDDYKYILKLVNCYYDTSTREYLGTTIKEKFEVIGNIYEDKHLLKKI